MLVAAAAERNKGEILKVLQTYINSTTNYKCLEIASGTGTHASYFAQNLPNVEFQPTERNTRAIHSIVAHVDKFRLENMRVPLFIDVAKAPDCWALPADFGPGTVDILLNINMIHISSDAAVQGLFRAAEGLLKRGTGILLTYGPYAFEGTISPDSNVRFDAGLRAENSEWGLRDVMELKNLAKHNGMLLEKVHNMSVNNHCLVFRRNP